MMAELTIGKNAAAGELFMKLPKAVACREDVSFPAKVIYAAMRDLDAMGLYPGVRAVSAAIGRPRDNSIVSRAQEELAEKGLLGIERGKSGTRTQFSFPSAHAQRAPTENGRLLGVGKSADSQRAQAPTGNRHIKTRERDSTPPNPPKGGNGKMRAGRHDENGDGIDSNEKYLGIRG